MTYLNMSNKINNLLTSLYTRVLITTIKKQKRQEKR